MTITVAIAGAGGRMGRMLIEAALAADDIRIGAALDRAGSPELGRDCAEFLGRAAGVAITDDPARVREAQVLIDFTRPEGTLEHLKHCVAHGVAMVIGTTGFDAAGTAAIGAAAQKIPIVFAPNMSVGVNATLKLLEVAAKILSSGYDIE
ncbi:MAG: 4-hydroxy-tetrahydrodipicolinate reductase, partial [Burkholderiaceae bacterium]